MYNSKRMIKNKFVMMILLMLYAMGSIGGFGYACYSGAYLIAFAVLVLAVMAWPTAWKCVKDLFM